MFKWILWAAVAALVVILVVMQRSAVKTSYVNGLPLYFNIPGHQFIFEQDCYIFKLTSHPTDWALVGTHGTVPELPVAFDLKNVGADFPGVRILDVARIGDRFKIVSVRRDVSRKGTSISFEILFTDEERRAYPRLDAFYIMDHGPEKTGQAPGILPYYAVPRVTRN